MSNGRALERKFGASVRHLRERRGITQEELASRANVHPGYVSQLERGLKSPSLRVIVALARGLEVHGYELVRSAEEGLA